MKHQVLIASYKRDFEWLGYCLESLTRHSQGLLRPTIAVPFSEGPEALDRFRDHAFVKAFDGARGTSTGFARAQEAMLSGDLLCPEADYVWLLGSDCIATGPFSPADFCGPDGRPVMQYLNYKDSGPAKFWQAGCTKALGWQPEHECMRRLPLLYPKALFPLTRSIVSDFTRSPFTDYVLRAVNHEKDFSESNVLGAVAQRYLPGAYHWVDVTAPGFVYRQTPFLQFWSHGGLDRPCDHSGYVLPSGGTIDGKTPRDILAELANCKARISELESENATLLMWATSLERELDLARGEPESRA